MVKKLIIGLFLTVTYAFYPLGLKAAGVTNEWVPAQNVTNNLKAVISQPDIEVFSSQNLIVMKVNKKIEVRVFTILGKLVTTQKLEPGFFELKTDSHGIYIIKTEDTSCKVAV